MSKSTKVTLAFLLIFIFIFIFLWGLGEALVPLVFSFVLSYLLFPLIIKLEKKGVQRTISVLIVFSCLITMCTLSLYLIVPRLFADAKELSTQLPSSLAKAIDNIEILSQKYGYDLDLSESNIRDLVEENVSMISSNILKTLTSGLKGTISGVSKWLTSILNLFLIPLFFFYIINDFERISNKFENLLPSSFRDIAHKYKSYSNTILSGYIRGQLLVALCLSILYSIGLSIIGLKFGLLIGLISGMLSIIPYAGFAIGFVMAMTMALAHFTGFNVIIGVVIVYSVVQGLEGMLITPKLVGDKVGLSALSTMLALIVGGNIYGLVGMLLAIPIAAISKRIFSDLLFYIQGHNS